MEKQEEREGQHHARPRCGRGPHVSAGHEARSYRALRAGPGIRSGCVTELGAVQTVPSFFWRPVMKIDFDEVKQFRIVDVMPRYLVKLRYVVGSEYASCRCPLPMHPQGDKDRNFCIHLPTNRWQCKNDSCSSNNGVGDRWGDCVNLVALLEGFKGNKAQYLAGVKISDWSNGHKKTAPQIEARAAERENQPPSSHIPDNTSPAVAGKGYMKALDAWFDEFFELTPEMIENEYWVRMRKGVKDKIYESYK